MDEAKGEVGFLEGFLGSFGLLRVVEAFLQEGHKSKEPPILTVESLRTRTGLSRKSIGNCLRRLKEYDMIYEVRESRYIKYYPNAWGSSLWSALAIFWDALSEFDPELPPGEELDTEEELERKEKKE